MMFPETTQIWGKEFPGRVFFHDARELLFFVHSAHRLCRVPLLLPFRPLNNPLFKLLRAF